MGYLNLTFAGRAQLIKSVLSTLHSYWASVFILSKGIINIIETKLRKFLWQGSTGRGYAKVAWDQLCRPKEERGLGVHNILVINKALMLKHLWKIIHNDRHSIWVDWILHHRLCNNSLWTFNGSTGSWGWKKIKKLRPVQRGIIYQVGTGTTFKLWQDIWHQQGPLSISYPRGPEVTGWPLNSLLSKALQRGHWNWPNRTDPYISEIVSQLPPVHQNSPDTIIWRHASGQFSIKSVTELIQPPTDRVVWHGLLQGRYKIPRHNFILWLAILEKLSTLDKHWISRGDNGCVLCDGQSVSTGLSRVGNNASNGLVKDGDLNTRLMQPLVHFWQRWLQQAQQLNL
ncbi:UNVERIFIED_CONTAM: putative mitochondrial protein [Sesamum angustifolium]|uniref:Mitochondrial protein n=1 Tax=Sesamum angustifolium TaxID=2727405 RepID=A0AAW2RP30_9LAMI